jgi:pyruvate dehydrogenase E1 component alpha subunit
MEISKNKAIALYQTMVEIRRFEERVSRLYAKGKIPGFVHLYIGEEAVAAGVCSCLTDEDYITSTHRGHGHLIAKGGQLNKMMAELYGKRTGYCKGKGGSMHIADTRIGILGANGIVGGGFPIAVGAAYGLKLQKKDHVVVDFFGDGSTNEGTFHEAMNAAAAFDLPVVFVCENNHFGVSTRIDRITKESNLVKRAVGYGMEGVSVDGTDAIAVWKAAGKAIEKARTDHKPTLIVADTWRHHGHFEGEHVMYWKPEELDAYLKKDPIERLAITLVKNYGADQKALDDIHADVEMRIDEAVAFAQESPFPQPEEALEDLYWEA